jgi:homotetrameric cytidine deaminase
MTVADLKHNSYVPYSGRVAHCVVQSTDGHCFAGVRIENVVFPLSINEVQSAVFACLSEGEAPHTLYVRQPQDSQLNFWQREFSLNLAPISELGDEVVLRPVILPNHNLTESTLLETILDRAITLNSDFPVSALIKTEQGVVTGVNIECSEWSMGLCAERVALAKAISYGARNFQSMHVHSRYGEFSSPCGACRQVMLEHLPRKPVHLYHADHSHSVHFVSDLLPFSFCSSTLRK